jgi:hypothetical protein
MTMHNARSTFYIPNFYRAIPEIYQEHQLFGGIIKIILLLMIYPTALYQERRKLLH